VLVNQSSGSVLAGSGAISLGGTAASMTHTYNLSGGLVSGGSLQLGADIGGTAVTTFNLLGGKLLISGTISGAQAANAKQDFVFNSGTLAAGTIDMTKLVSGGSVGASAGCLTNNGGTLAPGDVGSSGKMTITGNYTNNSSSSVLDIDLNGATQAGVFADPGKYDFVSISGKAQIGGNLNVRVGSGYTPGATTAFTVLTTSANGLSGSFANVRGNGRYYSSNPAGASFLVINTGTSIIVSNVVPLTASFTASPSAALTNNPLATFTDTSIGFSITNRVWNFGDGTTVTNNGSTTQNHTFPVGVAASYNVVLAVTGDDGSTAYATNVYSVVSQFRQIVWAGTANTWDFAANDWLVNGSTATAFGNSDNVVFDQTGAAQPTVNLNVTAVPYSVTFSNTSAAYTIQGAGKITGATGLTLGSGGSVTLLTTNNYTGPTVIKSGTLTLGNGATSGSIDSTSVVTNNGALVVNQADSHSLPAIVGSGSLTKLGAGALTLNGANTYTGSTAISNGTLTVATSLSASSPVLVASGTGAGALTVNAGATVGGNVEAQVSSAAANANVVNNGTISGTLTLDGTANQGNGSVASGNATLNGGSATGPVVDEGQLTIAGSTAVTVGTINGVTGFGAIHQNNTVGSGVFLNLANGASLANLNFGAGTATTVTNHGTVTLGYYGLSANVNWFSTLVGGIWNITNSIGANNANTVNYGTNTLLGGAVINVPSTANGNLGSQWTHGTWNLINGSLNIGGSLGSINGNTNSGLNITVNNSGGGASELTVSNNYSVGMSYRTNSIAYNSLTIGTGGSATINNNLYVGDTTGAATQISETNVVNLSGGKLLVAGTISAAPDGTGRTASFNWTGGQLTANTIMAGAGFNNLSSSLDATTLTNSAGTLAPGDLGVSGETIINGNYVQAGSGVLAIDIGGTNAAIGFQNGLANYDNLQVNGTAELGGTLTVSFINGYMPSGSVTNTIINASGGFSGAFSTTNLPSLPSGYSWQVEQTATLLNLVVTAPSSGAPTPTNITFTVSAGGQMTLNWPNSLGWVLEAQTNSLSTGLVSNTNAWTRMSAATSPFIVTPDAAQPTVFYRLVYP
jgi:autotransporter-associated beta strand protein